MKNKLKTSSLFLIISVIIVATSCKNTNKNNLTTSSEIKKPVFPNLLSETEKLIDTWYPKITDATNGGYYTNFSNDWESLDQTNKMIVTQARGLWTASRAYQKYPNKEHLKDAADGGFTFLKDKMWDQTNGGFLQIIPKREGPMSHKLVYGHTFGIYAMAEYYKINPSPEVKEWMMKAFQWMEDKSHDHVNGGYNNIVLDENIDLSDPQNLNNFSRLGWGHPGWKDQNTSIHIMEALTTLYTVNRDPKVRERLEEMLMLIRDKQVCEAGYLNLYFTSDWQPISHIDSTLAYINANLGIDHISFGHNIETAYLLIDAAIALNGKVDDKTLSVAKKLTDHSLEFGFDKDYYGIYDRGFLYKGDEKLTVLRKEKVWWAQAEAVHTLALMCNYFPENMTYKVAAQKMWQYIDEQLIDHTNGGWYPSGLDITPDAQKRPKGNQWKGAYHNARALINMTEL